MTNPTPPGIRLARPDEADALTELAMRSKAYWGYDDEFMETFRPELTILPEQIERDHVAVIEHDDQLAGYVHLRPESGTTLELVSLFIDTWAIRQGFGQRLWHYAIAYAREHGYREITLEADPNAEPFYLRQGAVVTGTRESSLMPGRVLNVMTLAIEPLQTLE